MRSLMRNAVEGNHAAGRPLQAGYELEQRALTTARYSDHRDELTRSDVERDVFERDETAGVLSRIGFPDLLQRDTHSPVYCAPAASDLGEGTVRSHKKGFKKRGDDMRIDRRNFLGLS